MSDRGGIIPHTDRPLWVGGSGNPRPWRTWGVSGPRTGLGLRETGRGTGRSTVRTRSSYRACVCATGPVPTREAHGVDLPSHMDHLRGRRDACGPSPSVLRPGASACRRGASTTSRPSAAGRTVGGRTRAATRGGGPTGAWRGPTGRRRDACGAGESGSGSAPDVPSFSGVWGVAEETAHDTGAGTSEQGGVL